jgi:hypothetical protein
MTVLYGKGLLELSMTGTGNFLAGSMDYDRDMDGCGDYRP